MNGTKLEKIEKAEDPDEFHELDEKICFHWSRSLGSY